MAARSWCFTYNNPSTSFVDYSLCPNVRYAVHQLELGDSGTLHLQGYVELASPERYSYFRACGLGGAHFERRRGTRESARLYCMKYESRIEGPFQYGEWIGGNKNRMDLITVRDAIKAGATDAHIAEEYFSTWVRYHRAFGLFRLYTIPVRTRKTYTIAFVGEPGTGKSRAALRLMRSAYWKSPGDRWFDGYQGEDVVIDDFRGGIEIALLLRLLDRYPLNVEVKGGFVPFCAKIVLITSNYAPALWYDSCRNTACDLAALGRRIDMVVTSNFEEFELPNLDTLDL